MPEIIFDSCVLSNFALADAFLIVERLYAHSAFITAFVAAEILRGIQKGHSGLERVQAAQRAGWIKEINLAPGTEKSLFETLSLPLGLGEASAIAAAVNRGWIFACDDRLARREAASRGVKLTGTIGILIKATNRKIVNADGADKILTLMVKRGFYSPIQSLKKRT
jgi:predicted nucleic acid-binding protein